MRDGILRSMKEEEKPVDETELLFMQAELGRGTPSLDLHGKTADEAEGSIDRFLNEQFMGGRRTVKIIHGKGTGKLQEVTRKCLQSHPLVEAWRDSSKAGEEGAVVYVILEERG